MTLADKNVQNDGGFQVAATYQLQKKSTFSSIFTRFFMAS